MKNGKMPSSYLSTTQAAQRLGLSVGTVQRMVETGVLQAYTTQGGHRRILTSSVNHYCRGAVASAGHTQVCVLAATAEPTPDLAKLNQIGGLHLITNPLELAGLRDKIHVLFMDARIPWLPWNDLHLADSLGTDAHCIVFHSTHLPETIQATLHDQATLYPGHVSADLVQGYLLGSAAAGLHTAHPPMHGTVPGTSGDLPTAHH